jgi:ElaB/YqjD/DUF883 family membrane-anchored ribosome-binding protein
MAYDTYDKTARSLADDAEDAARTAGTRYGRAGSASRALQTTGGDPAGTARGAADSLGGRIQEQPLVAILIAAVIGYIVGRIGRHI